MIARILIVDDEAPVRDVLDRYLRAEGYQTLVAADGQVGITLSRDADLVLLDLMLPVVDGYEVLRQVRAKSNIPVIMLTAKKNETDRIVGLRMGADDYVVKPFSPGEVVARVRAVLRRASTRSQDDRVLRIGDLRVNVDTRVVENESGPLQLTAHEFDLLAFLSRHPLQVFTREQLLDRVWDYHAPCGTTTVSALVCRLREKIEPDPLRPMYVKTVWGVGYKLQA